MMTAYDEDTVARLLEALPPAPEAWVKAAQEIPLAWRGLDELVERAVASLAERDVEIADLEAALAEAGFEQDRVLVEAVRARLEDRRGPRA